MRNYTMMLTAARRLGKLTESIFFIGTKNLISDATLAMTILCPLVAGLFCIVYVTRRGMADEQDKKLWKDKIVTAIICGVAGSLISGIISLIASYYGA